MAAKPAVVVTSGPLAGQAVPVEVVSSGAVEVGPAIAVRDVTGNPNWRPSAGAPMQVRVVSDGRQVAAGPAIPVWVMAGSLSAASNPQLGAATVAALGTTFSNDMSPDGVSWAAVKGATFVDQYGKIVSYIQRYNSNTRLCYFLISNDSGVTWADNTGVAGGEGFLTRGHMVYDAGRDCIHGLIMTTNPGDGGIIYRRYSITRDGSNNITSIARVAGVSVSLDSTGLAYEFPTIIMPNTNTLLIAWTVRAGSGGEIRACKCDITSNADAGGTASNWVHIGINSSTTIGASPAVASYTIPYTTATTAPTYFSLLQLASGDLRWVYHSGNSPGTYRTRRSVLSAAVTWNSLSTPVDITNQQRSGTDTGYSLKPQLISQQSEKSGIVYVGMATWKSNANGDTWGVYKIAADDSVSSSVDVYSAGGAHSYAPTGDCVYDSTADRLVVTYEQTTTQDGYIGLLLPSDLSTAQAFAAFETASDIDIPVIATPRVSGKALVMWRIAGAPPKAGKKALIPWQ